MDRQGLDHEPLFLALAWFNDMTATLMVGRLSRRFIAQSETTLPERSESIPEKRADDHFAFPGEAALTIARMPAFKASGRSGHASTTATKSGSVLQVSVGK